MSVNGHMITKKQRKSSRKRSEYRASCHRAQGQAPGVVEKQVKDFIGKKKVQVPNRKKRRADKGWQDGRAGRAQRESVRQSRRDRQAKARVALKQMRYDTRRAMRRAL